MYTKTNKTDIASVVISVSGDPGLELVVTIKETPNESTVLEIVQSGMVISVSGDGIDKLFKALNYLHSTRKYSWDTANPI